MVFSRCEPCTSPLQLWLTGVGSKLSFQDFLPPCTNKEVQAYSLKRPVIREDSFEYSQLLMTANYPMGAVGMTPFIGGEHVNRCGL